MSGPEKLTERTAVQAEPGVVCAKCKHVNAHGRNVCEDCGAHLHVVCHNCGHRNERVRHQCTECGHNLHRSLGRRLTRAFSRTNGKMSLLQIILLILGIVLAIGVIVLINRVS